MLPFYLNNKPLPLSLFHPRWLLDGPPVIHKWKMSLSAVSSESSPLFGHVDRLASSHRPPLRYAESGAQLIRDAASKAIETLKALPAGQKEAFISGFKTITLKLGEKAGEIVKRQEVIAIELPLPLT